MEVTQENKSLSESMEQTLETSNLSFLGDIGEVMIDAVMEDGLLKDIPILGAIVGAGKCVKNVSDMLFTKKLIAFLFELRATDAKKREEAIAKWESDSKYRMRIGETLLNMINRCDDTQKAKWLSKLFYELVLKKQDSAMFMRAEKVLSALSVMDVQAFLNLPPNAYRMLKVDDSIPFAHSGLYLAKTQYVMGGGMSLQSRMYVTEAGKCIYEILNNGD